MWEEETPDSFRRKLLWWVGGLVIVAAAGFGLWYKFLFHPAEVPPPAAAVQPAHAPAPEPAVSHPLPAAAGGSEALPALNDSDAMVQESLTSVLGRPTIEALLVPQNIVRHIVVTIDNLPRHKVAVDLRPVKPTPGQTVVSTQGGDLVVLSDANFERYSIFVRAVQAADVKGLAAMYQRLYPLFQQAYEDLGYPGKYFNDRVVEVIDHLLETPEIAGPIRLEQPRVFYTFADAGLESRSAGQKLLLRMGPANERIVKAKLRELRAEIVAKK